MLRSVIKLTKHHVYFRNVFTSTWEIARWVSSLPYTFKNTRAHERCTDREEFLRRYRNRCHISEHTLGVIPNSARKRVISVRTLNPGLFRIIALPSSVKRSGVIFIFAGDGGVEDARGRGTDYGFTLEHIKAGISSSLQLHEAS